MLGVSRRAAIGLAIAIAIVVALAAADRSRQPSTPVVSLVGLLHLVPDTAANRSFVVVNDYAAARSSAGLARPSSATEAAYLAAMTTATSPGLAAVPSIISGGRTGFADAWTDDLGYSFGAVDGDIVAGQGGGQLEAAVGVIDPTFVDAAATASIFTRAGRHDSAALYRTTAGDRLGLAKNATVGVARVATHQSRMFGASTPAGTQQLVDASVGATRSLADDHDIAVLASTMTARGVHSMFATTAVDSYARDTVVATASADTQSLASAQTTVDRYRAFATGIALVDGGPAVVVAFEYDSTGAAATNASRFAHMARDGYSFGGQRPWSQLFVVDHVAAEGRLVVATLTPRLPRLWYDVVVDHDSLLWWS